jgi:hypothetical protein
VTGQDRDGVAASAAIMGYTYDMFIGKRNVHLHSMSVPFTSALYPVAMFFLFRSFFYRASLSLFAYYHLLILATLSSPVSYLAGIAEWKRKYRGAPGNGWRKDLTGSGGRAGIPPGIDTANLRGRSLYDNVAKQEGGGMKTAKGLWIDHRKALIVAVTDSGEEAGLIISRVEKQLRRTGEAPMKGHYESRQVPRSATRQRIYTQQLNAYYDAVIASIRDANAILLFGPGEATGELKKRLKRNNLADRIVGIEAVDKMTDRQVAAKVRNYFLS